MFQIHYPTIRPQTTAHLAQTMTLLSLTNLELKQHIDSELASNPALELVSETRCPVCKRILKRGQKCPACSRPKSDDQTEPIVFITSYDDHNLPSSRVGNQTYDEFLDDDYPVQEMDLAAYVMRQVVLDIEAEDRQIAAHLLLDMDEDGILSTPLVEIAHYFYVPISRVERVQKIIQKAKPIGVCSCSVQDALSVQLEVLAETLDVPQAAYSIVRDGLELLSHKQYSDLARRLGVSVREVKEADNFINKNLNPFPGRAYWGDEHASSFVGMERYSRPDIVIRFLNEDPESALVIEILSPYRGTLRVNQEFKKASQAIEDEEKKELWRKDIESASLLVKCLQQRNNTMLRLMQKLAVVQRDFIVDGEKALAPVTRAHFAHELNVHESTISRAVSNKTIQLPNKQIIPLSRFFERNLSARAILREIIETETTPLSDAELVKIMASHGIKLARRTVAKYRTIEGILPAHLRRKIKVK